MSALAIYEAIRTGGVTAYEAMRLAVETCVRMDETKDWHDQASALAELARQRDDVEVEVWMREIKLRASVRIGEIVRSLDIARTGRPKKGSAATTSFKDSVIDASGLSRHVAYDYQRIAGPRDTNLQAAGKAAQEKYFLEARGAQVPATKIGLQRAVTAAVHAAMGPEEIGRAAKGLRADQQARKRERRDARIVTLAHATQAAASRLRARLYNVILADPPWRYEAYSAETGMDRAADNHYPTMTTDDIAALVVPSAPTCGLFLWATAPMLFEAGDVLRAWGFGYSTHYVWNKPRIGLGYRVRNKHEILLIGTRGGFPLPSPDSVMPSVIDAPLGRHSEKPSVFAEILERQYPTLAKVEMFARVARPGWDAWGNEVEAGAPERELAHA